MDEDEVEDWDYETGPFCRHWSDPSDCYEMCKCGHPCRRHLLYEDGNCDECDCEKFEDV